MKSLYSLLPDREDLEQVADGLTSCGTVLTGGWVFIWLEPQRDKFDYTHGGLEEDYTKRDAISALLTHS